MTCKTSIIFLKSKSMSKEYKIMHISDGEDSRFGTILIVKANPVINNGYSKSYISHLCSDTETFFFPLKKNIIDNLEGIANEGNLWTPNMSEFKTEYVRDEETNEKKIVYRHMSFWQQHDVFSASHSKVSLIPEKQSKITALNNQYFRNGWYESCSFYEYVKSLAENDSKTNFWQWLFNTSKFNGYDSFDLPHEYYISYKTFLKDCEEKDM